MKAEQHQCNGLPFDNEIGTVTTDHLIPIPVKLSRFRDRLVISHCGNHGESQLTLTPEQEVEFWKQVAGVIDEEAAYHCLKEAEHRALNHK